MAKTVQLKDKDGSVFPKVSLPFITARPGSRYSITTGSAYSTNQVNLNTLSAKSTNADLYFTITSNGIRVKKTGWYLVMASASYNTNSALSQSELILFADGSGVGQPAFRGGIVGINQTIYPSQPVLLNANQLITIGITSSIGGIAMEVYERSILSLMALN